MIKNEIFIFGNFVDFVFIWINFGLFLGIICLWIYLVNIGFVIIVVKNVIMSEYNSIFLRFVL